MRYFGNKGGGPVHRADGNRPDLWWAWDDRQSLGWWVSWQGHVHNPSGITVSMMVVRDGMWEVSPVDLGLLDRDLRMDNGL